MEDVQPAETLELFSSQTEQYNQELKIMKWFGVSYDAENITISRRKLFVLKSIIVIQWARIIRICFLAGDHIRFDEVYIFTDERPESYVIPMDASGGFQLWSEIIERRLFDAELAVKAASSTSGELFCWPSEIE